MFLQADRSASLNPFKEYTKSFLYSELNCLAYSKLYPNYLCAGKHHSFVHILPNHSKSEGAIGLIWLLLTTVLLLVDYVYS